MISVCIATYNGERYIGEQLSSILTQLSEDDEIIVSDDASSDNTLSVINCFNDRRIKIFRFERDKAGLLPHQLASSNFENAIRKASGDYIFLSDQDDVWDPGKVLEFRKYFADYDLIMSDACFMRDGRVEEGSSVFKGKKKFGLLIKNPYYIGCCMAFKRTLVPVILPFPSKLVLHDAWIGMLGNYAGRFKMIEKPLLYYRIHNNNVSVGRSETNSLVFKIGYRLYIYRHLAVRICRKGRKINSAW